jgi:hypothetical protein
VFYRIAALKGDDKHPYAYARLGKAQHDQMAGSLIEPHLALLEEMRGHLRCRSPLQHYSVDKQGNRVDPPLLPFFIWASEYKNSATASPSENLKK